MKKIIIFGILGFILGISILLPKLGQKENESNQWRLQWMGTRDAWLADRRDWRDGKPFIYYYGPHGSRW